MWLATRYRCLIVISLLNRDGEVRVPGGRQRFHILRALSDGNVYGPTIPKRWCGGLSTQGTDYNRAGARKVVDSPNHHSAGMQTAAMPCCVLDPLVVVCCVLDLVVVM